MLKDIQALRCIAICFVIFLHLPVIIPNNHFYNELRSFTNTDSGVELFFVIAGFFLSLTIEKSAKNLNSTAEKINFLFEIYIKKIKRLSPPVYFWVAVPLAFSILTKRADIWLSYDLMIEKFFSSLMWVRNFEEIGTEGNFGYMWALSLEMQFFIIYPMLYSLLGRKNTILLSIFICVSMMFYRLGGGASWMFRFDPMLYGTLLYYVTRSFDFNKMALKHLNVNPVSKFIIALILILSLAVVPKALIHLWNFRFSCASIISSICVLLAVTDMGFFTTLPKFINQVISYVGSRSFSFFCCHIPVWFMVFQFTSDHDIGVVSRVIFQISAVLIASELTYRMLERTNKKQLKNSFSLKAQ